MNENDTMLVIWFRLMRIAQKMGRSGGGLIQSFGVTPPQFLVMLHLQAQENDNLTQQQLADALLVTKGNISQILKIMEREGLIVREQEGAANKISLTACAYAILEKLQTAHTQFVHDHLNILSEAEQVFLIEILAKLDCIDY